MGAERPPPGSQRWVEILRRLSSHGPPERQARGYGIDTPSIPQHSSGRLDANRCLKANPLKSSVGKGDIKDGNPHRRPTSVSEL